MGPLFFAFHCRMNFNGFRVLSALGGLAIAVGFLYPHVSGPLVTFNYEWLAALGWLLLVAGFLPAIHTHFQDATSLKLLLAIPALLLLYSILDMALGRSRGQGVALYAITLFPAACVAYIGFVSAVATRAEDADGRHLGARVWYVAACGIAVAALANGFIGFLQHFLRPFPNWLGEIMVLPQSRPFGNLRQANLYSLHLTLGVVACCYLALLKVRVAASTSSTGSQRLSFRSPTGILFTIAVVFLGAASALSSSRTGVVIMWAIAIIGLLARPLPALPRFLPLIAAASHNLAWFIYLKLDELGLFSFVAVMRPVLGGSPSDNAALNDISGLRFGIWRGAIEVISNNLLWGVGQGNMNYAYFAQELSLRIGNNIQHVHNLFLQLLLEFGVVRLLLWLAVFIVLLWRVRRGLREPTTWLLLMGLSIMFIHSQLELPLWYLTFLLPAAFMLGGLVGVGASASGPVAEVAASDGPQRRPALICMVGFALLVGIGWDYQKILPIFTGKSDLAVMQRLERGYTSYLFSNYVDYAVVTTTPVSPENAALHHKQSIRVLRSWIDASLLVNLALSSAMLGSHDEAALYLWRIREVSPAAYNHVVSRLLDNERNTLAVALQKNEARVQAQTR